MIDPFNDEYFMREAYRLAQKADESGEIPVGAVVVAGNQIIGKGFNQTEKLKDSTAHAEMIALTSAFQYLGAKYLHECRLFVTLEPCIMCAGALQWSQIDEIIFGAKDPGKGYSLFSSSKGKSILHPRTSVKSGVMEVECGQIVEEFFKRIRDK
jgi:tRNA(adenine34) deaminase